eukprot:472405_1
MQARNNRNNTYVLKIDEENEITKVNDKQREKTFTDDVLDNMCLAGIETNTVLALKEYLLLQEYDTDSIENDIDIYDDEKTCNLLETIPNILNCIEEIKNYMKMANVASAAFSTGFVFWYWKYYEHVDDNQIRQEQEWWVPNDFGGYGVRELFVTEKFQSLKQEVLNSKFISISFFNEKVIAKGDEYYKTKKCKNMKCVDGDPLHFGIETDTKLEREHLYVLVLYCDFSDFCTSFSSTFRRMKWNEPVSTVRERNRNYYHISKRLRELIQYYGITGGNGNDNGKESGPFFSGLSFVLHIPEFCIRLNGPTSTT